VASLGIARNGLADLYGNVWEWTSDSFRPYPALAGGYLEHAEKAVRGGSWANSAADLDIASRGGIVAYHGSAFLGFRPAILRK
jgi:formylglycine-generating enzyme required for sulfatase activity